jgi:hypothetical protein
MATKVRVRTVKSRQVLAYGEASASPSGTNRSASASVLKPLNPPLSLHPYTQTQHNPIYVRYAVSRARGLATHITTRCKYSATRSRGTMYTAKARAVPPAVVYNHSTREVLDLDARGRRAISPRPACGSVSWSTTQRCAALGMAGKLRMS